jgi:hypothetical protein
MQTRNRNAFTTIHTEGALLPVDLLQRISSNDASLEGLDAESYHLAPGEKLNEAINRSWNRLNGLWGAFQTARGRLGPNDAGTTLTRERWLLPLFQELGFGRLSTAKAVEIEGKFYPISHRWQNIPLHLVGCGLELDKRTPGAAGAARISPHSLLQEYLNRSDEAQWGLVSNGLSLRVLRDNATLTRQAYIEFDLESMFDGEVYSDFVLLWLICHQSRFEAAEKQNKCILERWSQSAQERGTRALDDLRRGVEEAIVNLGQGFLQHPFNGELRAQLKKGDLSAQDYYRQLLRLVYRLIFLFASEDRNLLLLPDAPVEARQRYQNFYSTARLRALAEHQRGSRHHDRYEALRLVMILLGSEKGCPELAIPALGGFLFDERSTSDLNGAKLDNQSLLAAVRSLGFITEGNIRRAVDYRNLGPEELGSVYESLLELHPLLNTDAGTFQLSSVAGNERKTTGSYYTPSSLIRLLLDSALDPVIEARLKSQPDAAQQEQILLNLKVCDPACGSGHFLIAAAHRIASRLAQVRAGGDEPSPNETRRALRDVIRHCIYGVDINPMAVELCKVNLWLESIEPGKPLSFLDAHIQCGDSLVGVGPGLDISEIPDEAFNPAFGDDNATSAALKKRNKLERSGQMGFRWNVTILNSPEELSRWRAERAGQVEEMPENDPNQVQAKAHAFAEFQQAQEYIQNRMEYDLWTAAFFWPMPKGVAEHILAPTQQELLMLRSSGNPDAALVEQVRRMSKDLNFFHWELAFAQVFSENQNGFDCILGNPPWEKINLKDEEFFAHTHPEIAGARTKAIREKLILELHTTCPSDYQEFIKAQAYHDNLSNYFRFSGAFPLTGVSRINLYSVFTEIGLQVVAPKGRLGLVIASGIATDDNNKALFEKLVASNRLINIFDFENREGIFPAIHRSYKFCIFCAGGIKVYQPEADLAFYLTRVEQIKNPDKHFSLSHYDLQKINPNTRTCPTFNSRQDAEIVKEIYNKVPAWCLHAPENVGIPRTPFNMSNDSNLFKTSAQIGVIKVDNDGCAVLDGKKYLPLYESKFIHQFNHRFASFNGETLIDSNESNAKELSQDELRNPYRFIDSRYWLESKLQDERFPGRWFLVYRMITRATDERTSITTIIPQRPCGNSLTIISGLNAVNAALVCSNMNTFVFDYVARHKIPGINFNHWILKQLPVLPISTYTLVDIDFIMPRLLELVYTAYDLKPFADDMGYYNQPFEWDEERRVLLRAELDAYYARLYGLTRDEMRFILDPQDVYGPDFPGETFRVLKEKEIKQYGEYRTRRLVLEAWDRLEGVEVGNPEGYRIQEKQERPIQSSITVTPQKEKSQPAIVAAKSQEQAPNPLPKNPAQPEEQPALADFGLYKCAACGKMVLGFDKENHEREKHSGKKVEWRKVK